MQQSNMITGLQLAAVTLLILAIGQPALGANRRLLSGADTILATQLESSASEDIAHGRLLQQVTGARGAIAATHVGAGESTNSAQPLASSQGLRSTTGGQSSLGSTLSSDSTTRPGQVSIDSTSGDAANVANIRGMTNNAGSLNGGSLTSSQRAEGTVSADVLPSATSQGGGVRPSQEASSNLAMESMPESGSAMSMRSLP